MNNRFSASSHSRSRRTVQAQLPNSDCSPVYFLCMKEKSFFCMDWSRKPEKLQRTTGHWLCSEKMRTSKPV